MAEATRSGEGEDGGGVPWRRGRKRDGGGGAAGRRGGGGRLGACVGFGGRVGWELGEVRRRGIAGGKWGVWATRHRRPRPAVTDFIAWAGGAAGAVVGDPAAAAALCGRRRSLRLSGGPRGRSRWAPLAQGRPVPADGAGPAPGLGVVPVGGSGGVWRGGRLARTGRSGGGRWGTADLYTICRRAGMKRCGDSQLLVSVHCSHRLPTSAPAALPTTAIERRGLFPSGPGWGRLIETGAGP